MYNVPVFWETLKGLVFQDGDIFITLCEMLYTLYHMCFPYPAKGKLTRNKTKHFCVWTFCRNSFLRGSKYACGPHWFAHEVNLTDWLSKLLIPPFAGYIPCSSHLLLLLLPLTTCHNSANISLLFLVLTSSIWWAFEARRGRGRHSPFNLVNHKTTQNQLHIWLGFSHSQP